jgi:UDP-N-acetylglucosamine 4-epimerase
MYTAAKETKIERIIYAASSSTYGDSEGLPKIESKIGNPLSPYAVTKYVMELYAKVFNDLYGLDFIGLRYFNVFGPKQDPNGAYAAVIPLFFKHALNGTNPTINGDGSFSRDFTYVDNAVQANILALTTSAQDSLNEVYNVACGARTDLNQLWGLIKNATDSKSEVIHGPNRKGDVAHSLASIEKAQNKLTYFPNTNIQEGINLTHKWYAQNSITVVK